MEVIQRLGATIQADWERRDRADGAFVEVAAAALRACAELRQIALAELLRWSATAPDLSMQAVGATASTVFTDSRFGIDVVMAVDNTSEIREATAPGVVMLIRGTCVYGHYGFEAEHDYGDQVWVGRTDQRELAWLEAGDLRIITPGSAHTLFHCDSASFSVAVRMYATAASGRCYLRSGVAHAVAPAGVDRDRQVHALDALLNTDGERFMHCLRDLLGATDLATACGLVRRYVPQLGAQVCRAVLPDAAPARADLLAAVIDHAIHVQRAEQLAGIRRTLRSESHRLLLAILLSAVDRRDVLRLVALRVPGEDPADTIMGWLEQLAGEPSEPPGRVNAIGIELDDVMLFVTGALLQGNSDGEVATAMAEELEDAGDLREDVIAFCRSLRQSILAPLFTEPAPRSWSPAAPAAETSWLVGDRYQVLERIGQGGMGTVYSVLDRHRSIRCALKAVSMRGAHPAETRAQFDREVQIASAMAHPGIVAMIDTGEDDRLGRFMVMELVEGTSLDRMLARAQRLPARAACMVLRQVAEAVDYIHHHGIAHGDIKPGNILVVGDPAGDVPPVVKLFDFGRATSFTTAQPATSLVGTPTYLAPELIRGDGAWPASDIYALGIVLYELVTGRPPWDGPVRDVLSGHLEQPLPSPGSASDGGADPALEALILRATAKRPAERHRTAAELVVELDRVISSLAAS